MKSLKHRILEEDRRMKEPVIKAKVELIQNFKKENKGKQKAE